MLVMLGNSAVRRISPSAHASRSSRTVTRTQSGLCGYVRTALVWLAVPWAHATRADSGDGSLLLLGTGRRASPVLRRDPRPPCRWTLWLDVSRGRQLVAALRRCPRVSPVTTTPPRGARSGPHLLRRPA